jgi:hypothetical protein
VIFLIFAVAFRAAPDQIPSKSQQNRGNPFNFRSQISEIFEETETKVYLIISAFLLVYIFCSPYNLDWYEFEESTNEGTFAIILSDVQPYTLIAGILTFGLILSIT